MFLPIGDTPNPRTTPYVTYLLIGVNVAVFLLVSLPLIVRQPDLSDPRLLDYLRILGVQGSISAQAVLEHLSAYDLFVFRYGYRPAEPSLISLGTTMFLHAGWMHLLGNMLFLWIFGDNVEHRLGGFRYLLTYLATGVAATLFFAFFVPDSQVPLVGASGAISGILGLYFLWFPRNQVKVFIFFIIIFQIVQIPARLVLGFYLLIDNILPFLINGAGGAGVAHGAHIGGFVAGLGLAWIIDRGPDVLWRRQPNPRKAREDERQPAAATERRAPEVAEQISAWLQAGDLRRAASSYLSLTQREARRQVDGEDVLQIGEYLLENHACDDALSVFRRFVSDRTNDSRLARAYLGAGRALLGKPRCATSAYHYFLAALDVAREPGERETARTYLAAIETARARED